MKTNLAQIYSHYSQGSDLTQLPIRCIALKKKIKNHIYSSEHTELVGFHMTEEVSTKC